METFEDAGFESNPNYRKRVQAGMRRLFVGTRKERTPDKRWMYRRQSWSHGDSHYYALTQHEQPKFLMGIIPVTLGHEPVSVFMLSRLKYGETLERRTYWYANEELQAKTRPVSNPLDSAAETAEIQREAAEFIQGIHTPDDQAYGDFLADMSTYSPRRRIAFMILGTFAPGER